MPAIKLSSWVVLSLCVWAGLLGGCAAGTNELIINHGPLQPLAQTRQGTVLVRPFVDGRKDTQHIGNKRNGFGMVLGHVATQKDVKVNQLMTQYFIEALQHAGYSATLDTAPSGSPATTPCDAIIEGEIVEFWMDLYMNVWHRVGVKVRALNAADQQLKWEKLIQGAETRVLWVGATSEYERIVREALTKTLDQAAQEFSSAEFYDKVIQK